MQAAMHMQHPPLSCGVSLRLLRLERFSLAEVNSHARLALFLVATMHVQICENQGRAMPSADNVPPPRCLLFPARIGGRPIS